jgi:uncharacterized protein (TIGR02145 family)
LGQNNIGINNPNPDPSAALDITSSNMGFLPPRVTDTSAVVNPAEGLVIYDLATHCMRYFNGTIWSDCIGSFTPAWLCGQDIVDTRDGQHYTTVQIGNQCWMAENLNIGSMINGFSQATDNGIIEKHCYDDDLANCTTYGGLYTWNEIMKYDTVVGIKGICPEGWHIPTSVEFCDLINAADSGSFSCNFGYFGNDAGDNLRETGTTHWVAPNSGATNSSGFSALPAGIFAYNTPAGIYDNIGFTGYFWTSKKNGAYANS